MKEISPFRLNASFWSGEYSVARDLVVEGAARISPSSVFLILRPDFGWFSENPNVYVLAMVCAKNSDDARQM